MAKALMIQGTGSGAGKSLIAAALCRIFRDEGVNVAPFKAQNMALNSAITIEGGEIGRAQALQARAARVEAVNDMNPILLKASGESGAQVIIQGTAYSTMKAREYYAFKVTAWKAVVDSYKRISKKYDLVVLEGAGSPAEINLMDVDIVNMKMARHAKAPVLLVGDIDKGGVFASLYGTVKLLGKDSRLIKGFVINKFRGDQAILDPGLDMIRDKTGKPVIGVLPYIADIGLPEEDGMSLNKKLEGRRLKVEGKAIKIVVVRLKFISNFTDFDPLELEPDVEVVYSDNPRDIESADLVIIPGTKNTVKDLLALKESGLADSIKHYYQKGVHVMGMCGGYQMLGKKIFDPHCVESSHKEVDGLGLLNIETTFEKTKTTCRVKAGINSGSRGQGPGAWKSEGILRGYEIHMGRSTGDIGLFEVKRASFNTELRTLNSELVLDGSRNANGWGTYLHGIFDNDSFRRSVLNELRNEKGLAPLEQTYSYSGMQEQAIDAIANVVKQNLDMDFIRRAVGL